MLQIPKQKKMKEEQKIKFKVTYSNFRNETISYTLDNKLNLKMWLKSMISNAENWKSPIKIEAIKIKENE